MRFFLGTIFIAMLCILPTMAEASWISWLLGYFENEPYEEPHRRIPAKKPLSRINPDVNVETTSPGPEIFQDAEDPILNPGDAENGSCESSLTIESEDDNPTISD